MHTPLAIQVNALAYAYPGGSQALDQVSFNVSPGEAVGLIGPNGAGKTTLFLCLSGVLPCRAGMMRVCGLDPANAAQKRLLPAKVGIVFQNSDDQLFNATVLEDVAFGPLNLGLDSEATRRRVTEALAEVGLQGFERRVSFHLSGGEKRRVALAGILAMRPEALLLDEPSSYLDPRGRRELIHLINALPGTKLIASHDLEMVLETCRRVILLDGGRLIADGPAQALLAASRLMEAHGLETPYSLRKK